MNSAMLQSQSFLHPIRNIARTGHYEPICREAIPYVLVPGLLAFGLWWNEHTWLSFTFLLIAVAIALFFRNPERFPPSDEDGIPAPADGTVVEVVEDADPPHLDVGPTRRVSIFMSVFDVHVNRAPLSGRVRQIAYTEGGFLDARDRLSSISNERNSLILADGNDSIEVIQVAGKVARRISCWVRVGADLRRGERFGLIHFGSRLDVYMPASYEIRVKRGDKTRAGETVIARKPGKPGA